MQRADLKVSARQEPDGDRCTIDLCVASCESVDQVLDRGTVCQILGREAIDHVVGRHTSDPDDDVAAPTP